MHELIEDPNAGFEIKTRVSNRDIANLLCTAFEGGVGYWCIIVDHVKPPVEVAWMDAGDKKPKVWKNYDWPVTPGGAVIVAELDEWDEAESDGDTSKVKTYRIDREAIQRGLSLMQEKYARHFANFMNDNADAITGDVFLQCCCGFEEGVRYGWCTTTRSLDASSGAFFCEACSDGRGAPVFAGSEEASNDRCEECGAVLDGDDETRAEREARESREASEKAKAEAARVEEIERSLRELDDCVADTEADIESLKRELERKKTEAAIKREALLRKLAEED